MVRIAKSQEEVRLAGGTVTDSKNKNICKDFYAICMIYHTLNGSLKNTCRLRMFLYYPFATVPQKRFGLNP
jgi:hypothetical protein